MNRRTIRMKANRLRVFRACKTYMEKHQRTPTIEEIADEVGSTSFSTHKHLRALDGAEGLPFPTTLGKGGQHSRVLGGDNMAGSPLPVDSFLADERTRYSTSRMRAGSRQL